MTAALIICLIVICFLLALVLALYDSRKRLIAKNDLTRKERDAAYRENGRG